MSTAPIDRDKQIELMKNAAQRHSELFDGWVQDEAVRRVLSKPVSAEDAGGSYKRIDTKVACCG